MKTRWLAPLVALGATAMIETASAAQPQSGLSTSSPPVPSVILQPVVIQEPSAGDIERVYPKVARAQLLNGVAVLNCLVTESGQNTGCTATYEAPPGYGFGEAALALAPKIKMRPGMRDMRPIQMRRQLPVTFIINPNQPRLAPVIAPSAGHQHSASPGSYAELPAALSGFTLPSGRLGLVEREDPSGGVFVSLSNEPAGPKPFVLDVIADHPSSPFKLKSVLTLSRFQVDCSARTTLFLGAVDYDFTEAASGWTLPASVEDEIPASEEPHPFSEGGPMAVAAKMVCDKIPFSRIANSLQEARTLVE